MSEMRDIMFRPEMVEQVMDNYMKSEIHQKRAERGSVTNTENVSLE